MQNSLQFTQTKLNPTMSKTQVADQNFGFSQNSIISAANLRGKLLGLEEKILEVAAQINEDKKTVLKNGNDKDEIQEYLKSQNKEIMKKLSDEIDKVEEDMSNHFTKQKIENAKLQEDIANLKDQKRQLQDLLMDLQRKINDLEMQVGIGNDIPMNTV